MGLETVVLCVGCAVCLGGLGVGSGGVLGSSGTVPLTSEAPRGDVETHKQGKNAPEDGEGERDVEDDGQRARHVVEAHLHELEAEVVEGDHAHEHEGEDAHLFFKNRESVWMDGGSVRGGVCGMMHAIGPFVA